MGIWERARSTWKSPRNLGHIITMATSVDHWVMLRVSEPSANLPPPVMPRGGQIKVDHSPVCPIGFALSEEQPSRRYRPATRHPSVRRGRRTRRSQAGNLKSSFPCIRQVV